MFAFPTLRVVFSFFTEKLFICI